MPQLVVSVKPGARVDEVVVRGDEVEVRVRAPARDGLANEAVRRVLAAALGVAPGRVTLVRGATARIKAFEVLDLERASALALLAGRGTATLASKKPPDGL